MKKYRETGLKLTPQRLAILKYMEGNKDHPAAEEIYRAVSKRFPTMSFATVYNTLHALTRSGRVRELTIDPDKRRFDPDTRAHHHLICVECKKIVDIHRDFSSQLPGDENQGFEILGHHIEFYGLCPKCRSKASTAKCTNTDSVSL